MTAHLAAADALADNFRTAPESARPRTWWHWLNGYVTKEGITADLEAMRRIGLGSFQLFDGDLEVKVPDMKPVPYLSPEYLELLKHTASEAKRLGLEFTLVACPGWSELGAPWVEPAWAMQRMAWSRREVTGPAHLAETLPPLPAENDPLPGEKKKPAKQERPNGASQTPPQAVDACGLAYRSSEGGAPISREQSVDLTRKTGVDGTLTWDVPEGKWTILRVGSYPIRTMNHPARPEATGFKTDKLSAQATRNYFEGLIKRIEPSVEGGLNALLCESWEAGDQDWTPKFSEEFKRLRGYDPVPSLTLEGGWEVAFQPGCGAPAKATFAKLASWHEHADDGIKYFAGTATYTRKFDLPAGFAREGRSVRLDLGDVQVVAEVTLNGKPLATLWKPPFRVDVAPALKKGANTLKVKVTNLWPNRLIGDANTNANPPVAQLAYSCNIITKPIRNCFPRG